MKLIETIERCKKLVLDEIECYNFEIEWYQKNIGDTETNKIRIQKWIEERNELLEMMENLGVIANGDGLEPIPLEDGEPQQTDLDEEDCCWWWEEGNQSYQRFCGDAGGIASLKAYNKRSWKNYSHWLPHWAIKEPQEKLNETN